MQIRWEPLSTTSKISGTLLLSRPIQTLTERSNGTCSGDAMRASEFIAEGRSLIPYTQQQIDDVKAAYDQGYTTEDTAKLLDIGYMDVKRILDRHYTERTSKPRPKRIQHNQPEIDKIKAAWDRGMRPQEISKTLNIPRHRVNAILQYNYPDRPNKQSLEKYTVPAELSDTDKASIIAHWRQGMSLTKLAQQYNMHPSYVRTVVQSVVPDDEYAAWTAKQVTNKRAISKDDVPKIVDAYLNGKEIRDIAKDYGVNYNAIKYHLMQQGMTQAPSTKSFAYDVGPQDIDKMVNMRKAGKSVQQIADIMNVPGGTVRHYLAGRV